MSHQNKDQSGENGCCWHCKKPESVKWYDGCCGYEAVVCRHCGAYGDHPDNLHLPDQWSCSFVGIAFQGGNMDNREISPELAGVVNKAKNACLDIDQGRKEVKTISKAEYQRICAEKGIKHDCRCDICGKPAEFNIQAVLTTWTIDAQGEFDRDFSRDEVVDNVNSWRCDDHLNDPLA